jgi:hypothetical protein
MTRDVLYDNVDLLDHAGGLLAAARVHKLDVKASISRGNLRRTRQHQRRPRRRLRGRPAASLSRRTADHTVVSIPAVPGPERVRVEAFAGGDLVATDSADL